MASPSSSSRESRRRRIVERGTDRLALITGKLKSLPESSLSSSQPQYHHSHTVSSPSLLIDDQHFPTVDSQAKVAPHGDNDISSTELQKKETNIDTKSRLRKCETKADINRPSSDAFEQQPSPFVPKIQDVPNSAVNHQTPLRVRTKLSLQHLFTPNQISSSISASENTRICCAITIAILVVLSDFCVPNIIKRIVTSRPVFLVLLTDITIVLAHLFGQKETATRTVSEDGFDLGKALEIGMMLYKATNAAFMDCSIYAVVVICGLSLLGNPL